MNFEVLCFDGNHCNNKEYFDTFAEALAFERTQTEWEWVSITPLNWEAEKEMRRK